jgi:hypothetical protein
VPGPLERAATRYRRQRDSRDGAPGDARADATLAAPTYDIVLFTDHAEGDAALAAVDPTVLLPGGATNGCCAHRQRTSNGLPHAGAGSHRRSPRSVSRSSSGRISGPGQLQPNPSARRQRGTGPLRLSPLEDSHPATRRNPERAGHQPPAPLRVPTSQSPFLGGPSSAPSHQKAPGHGTPAAEHEHGERAHRDRRRLRRRAARLSPTPLVPQLTLVRQRTKARGAATGVSQDALSEGHSLVSTSCRDNRALLRPVAAGSCRGDGGCVDLARRARRDAIRVRRRNSAGPRWS